MNARNLFRYEPIAVGILRIMTGLLFLEHGIAEVPVLPAGRDGRVRLDLLPGLLPTPASSSCLCGLLVALGWFTRPAAFLASGHNGRTPTGRCMRRRTSSRVNNMGDAAILYCFVFLYLVFRGPGALSVDGDRRPVELTEAETSLD